MKTRSPVQFFNLFHIECVFFQLKSPMQREGSTDHEDDGGPPPALPSEPPPLPNWNTFPEGGSGTAKDDSFFNQSDLLPDTSAEVIISRVLNKIKRSQDC